MSIEDFSGVTGGATESSGADRGDITGSERGSGAGAGFTSDRTSGAGAGSALRAAGTGWSMPGMRIIGLLAGCGAGVETAGAGEGAGVGAVTGGVAVGGATGLASAAAGTVTGFGPGRDSGSGLPALVAISRASSAIRSSDLSWLSGIYYRLAVVECSAHHVRASGLDPPPSVSANSSHQCARIMKVHRAR